MQEKMGEVANTLSARRLGILWKISVVFTQASFYAPCIHVLESMVSPTRAYSHAVLFFYAL